ncbi:hypothetical protein HMPREF1882_01509 [Streptococcus agalactiae]|nr:hypothetical protein HMPREF1882_01509 [Streptococcus agalactiae]
MPSFFCKKFGCCFSNARRSFCNYNCFCHNISPYLIVILTSALLLGNL